MGREPDPEHPNIWGASREPPAGVLSRLGGSGAGSGTGQEGTVTGSNRPTQPLLGGQIKRCCARFEAMREDIRASILTG